MRSAIRFLHAARLTLPLAVALILLAAFAPVSAQGGATHTVQPGENLFRIALRYGLTVDYLAAYNGITNPTQIYAGQVLTIPDGTQPLPDPAPAAPAPAAQPAPVGGATHVVQRGETLSVIAQRYGVTWQQIAAANGIVNANTIYAGQTLTIPGAAAGAPAPAPAAPAPAPAASGERTHVVQPGEHLSAIARRYGLTWPTVARANNIANPNTIYAGQTLIIPAADDGQGGYAGGSYAPAVPAPTISTGKQIIVDLSDQRVYAYENGALLRNVLVSTGLWGTPTVQGDYALYAKYDAQLMSGPDYYLPGVPWVMYFYKGYSLHGTYWHNNFGQPMSHGCVNMPTPEAAWFYSWAPIGTPVHVQY